MTEIIIIVFWIACGMIHYTIDVTYYQTEYSLIAKEKLWADRIWAAVFALTGPIALIPDLILWHFKHGWGKR